MTERGPVYEVLLDRYQSLAELVRELDEELALMEFDGMKLSQPAADVMNTLREMLK